MTITLPKEPPMPPPSSTSEWLAARRTGIGGTDVAPILGISKWRKAHDVWLDKTGRREDRQTLAMATGKALEPLVRSIYEERHGEVITTGLVRDRDNAILLGTPDGVTDDAVVEFKTTTKWAFRSWRGVPPVDYWAQMQHYMMLTGRRQAVLAILLKDEADIANGYHEMYVTYDPDWIGSTKSQLTEWWETYVVADVEPPIPEDEEPLAVEGLTIASTDAIETALSDLKEVKGLEKQLSERRKELEAVVKDHMGTADTLVNSGVALATYRNVTQERFDSRAFKDAHPELYPQYTKEISYRQLVIK